MSQLEALDDDVLALLRAEKDVPELASAKKAALFATVASRVGFMPPSDGGGGGDSGGSGSAVGSAVGQGGGFALAGGKAVGALIATLALGVVGGVAIDRQIIAPAPMTTSLAPTPVTIAPPAATMVPMDEPRGVPVGALPAAPTDVRTAAPPPSARTEAPSPSSRGLAAERALLDVARGALARGEANEALVAAERHTSEYPNGALVEEREAIAIKALVALGRKTEARARAAEMERRFPNGLMLRAVKSAVEQAP